MKQYQSLDSPERRKLRLDHTIFRQNRELRARQSQFVAEDFCVVLADQRCPSGDPPRGAVIDRGLAGVDKAAAELRVLHLFPETAIMQVDVVKELLRSTHRPPGKAASLGGMVNLLGRQAGNEVGDEIIDYVRCARRNDCRVLVFGVREITSHAVAAQQVCQLPDEFRVQPSRYQRTDVGAVLGAELGTGRRTGCMMATCLTSYHLAPVDVVGDCRLGGKGASLVDRRVDILPLP